MRPASVLDRDLTYRNGNARDDMDPYLVCVIRSMHGVWGLSNAEIGRRLEVPRTTVRDIVRRLTWVHVPPAREMVDA
jgi:hypothetical protein